MLSKRAKYAIKALLFLSDFTQGPSVSAKVIAEKERIPFKFLENILRELRQNRIIKSERGAEGGYRFLKKPSEITVAEIIRIVDGPIALIPCVSENFYEKCAECTDENTCQIRKLFGQLRNDMLPVLDTTLSELKKL